MKHGLLLVAALSGIAAPPPPGGTLAIRVTNVRNAHGHVRVDLCPAAQFLKEDCPYSGSAPAQSGQTIVTLRNVPAGRYAVQAFHDENDNRKVDRIFIGVPKEGVGFSNDAPIRLSPPKWADAVFAFNGGEQAIQLKLRYFLGASGPTAR